MIIPRVCADLALSNYCLGASLGVGARHTDCPGHTGVGRSPARNPCGCDCHLRRGA